MNAQQIKDTIRKFNKADLTQVKDAELRAKGEKLQAKQGGFTLLELLVVVAILAVIAGAVISSLDGKEEGAAQATTVHTMATLESGMKVFKTTEKRLLPEELESLLCVSGFDKSGSAGTMSLSQADLDTNAGTAIVLSNSGNNSNVARVHGGLTEDLAGKLDVISVTDSDDEFTTLVDAGMTSLRYVDITVCNATEGETLVTNGADTVEDVELVEVTKPNLLFRDPVVDDDEWEYGAGDAVDLTSASGATPIAFFDEPGELGVDENSVVAVFGIGPDSSLTNNIIGRAPSDGNVGPDKYGHFSLAVKIGECTAAGAEYGDANCDVPGEWDSDDGAQVIAVLDGGGDAYDDEIAEAKGNEEE